MTCRQMPSNCWVIYKNTLQIKLTYWTNWKRVYNQTMIWVISQQCFRVIHQLLVWSTHLVCLPHRCVKGTLLKSHDLALFGSFWIKMQDFSHLTFNVRYNVRYKKRSKLIKWKSLHAFCSVWHWQYIKAANSSTPVVYQNKSTAIPGEVLIDPTVISPFIDCAVRLVLVS